MGNRKQQDQAVTCPVCGYDQCGEIMTWESSCPVDGRCVECGETFAWSYVYELQSQWDTGVDWYGEHANGLGELVKRTPGTLLRLVFPSRFFRDVNHRRPVRIWGLIKWILVAIGLVHLAVSVIGMWVSHNQGYWSRGGYRHDSMWPEDLKDTVLNVCNGVSYPFFVLLNRGGIELRYTFSDYGWVETMYAALLGVGVTLAWSVLMSVVLMVHTQESKSWRREGLLLLRVVLLSFVPILFYFEAIRLMLAAVLISGEEYPDWDVWVFLALLLMMVFWQQLIWTQAVRTIWRIKRSFLINVGGFFASVIFGVLFFAWFVM